MRVGVEKFTSTCNDKRAMTSPGSHDSKPKPSGAYDDMTVQPVTSGDDPEPAAADEKSTAEPSRVPYWALDMVRGNK